MGVCPARAREGRAWHRAGVNAGGTWYVLRRTDEDADEVVDPERWAWRDDVGWGWWRWSETAPHPTGGAGGWVWRSTLPYSNRTVAFEEGDWAVATFMGELWWYEWQRDSTRRNRNTYTWVGSMRADHAMAWTQHQ